MKVYLDNSATTQVDKKAARAMQDAMLKYYGNPGSMHYKGDEAKEILDKARETIAKSINAKPEEIIFTSGGTEANNLAIKGMTGQNTHIITTVIEHPSVEKTCKALEKEGYTITYLPVNNEGLVTAEQVEKAITPETKLVTIMHASNEIGTIQPIKEIAELCAKKKILFHTDAVQSFKKVPIDISKIPISAMSLSSHKIHGPKGVGALYLRKGIKINAQLHGGGHELGRRSGTENLPGIAGFAEAVKLKLDTNKIAKLRDYLIKKVMKEIPEVKLNGPKDNSKKLCNNASLSFKYIEGEGLLLHLSMNGICVSTGSACAARDLKVSYVLKAIGLPAEIAHGTIRFSLSAYNTKQEIDYTVNKLKIIVKDLRKMSPLGGKK
ncbi:MAG: cysteine desulfurase family protein [archaeon]